MDIYYKHTIYNKLFLDKWGLQLCGYNKSG